MSKLIAMVATAVLIDGQRTVIQPGEELPALPKHDEQELTASGAAVDPAKIANADDAAALTRAAADRHFQKEREAVQVAAAATQGEDKAGQSGKSAKADTSTKSRK